MSRLDIDARVYAENVPELADEAAPEFGDIPICQRCDDKCERLSA